MAYIHCRINCVRVRRKFCWTLGQIPSCVLILLHIAYASVYMIVCLSLAVIMLQSLYERLNFLVTFLVALIPALRLHFVKMFSDSIVLDLASLLAQHLLILRLVDSGLFVQTGLIVCRDHGQSTRVYK